MQTLAPVAKKRKRIRNPLELNSRDFRLFKDHSTPPSSYLQGSCALYELSSSQIKKRKNISKENLNQTTPKITKFKPELVSFEGCPGLYSARAEGIRYLYKRYGSPPRYDEENYSLVVTRIMQDLSIPMATG